MQILKCFLTSKNQGNNLFNNEPSNEFEIFESRLSITFQRRTARKIKQNYSAGVVMYGEKNVSSFLKVSFLAMILKTCHS